MSRRGGLAGGAIRGSVWTAIHVIVSLPVAFAVNLVVARTLGVVDYGRLGLLTMVMTLATAAASMGVAPALMQFGSKAYHAGRDDELVRLIRGSQGYAVYIAAPLVAIALFLFSPVSAGLLVVAVLFGVLAPAWFSAAPNVLALSQRSDRAAQIAIVVNLVVQMVVVLTAILVATPEALWVSRVVAVGLLMVVPLLAIPRLFARATLSPGRPWRLPRAFWRFAVPTGLAALLGILAGDRVQVFFLEAMSEAEAVGLFALAFGLSTQVLSPAQAMVGPMLPAFAALVDEGADRARAGLVRALSVSSVVTGAVVAVAAPVLAGLVPFLYGSEFTASGDYLAVLVSAATWVATTAPAYASLLARLQARVSLGINAISVVVMALVAMTTIPTWGAWGAVASNIAATLVRALLMLVLEVRVHRVAVADVWRAVAPSAWSTMSVISSWFLLAPYWQPAARPIVAGLAGGLLFVILLRISRTGLDEDEASKLLRHLPRALTGVARPVMRLLRSPSRA